MAEAEAMTTNQRIAAKAAYYDDIKRRGAAYARRVSAALNRAGVPKASPYKTFGRDRDGYITHHNVGKVAVLFTSREIGLEWQSKAREILEAAGFTVTEEHRLDRWHDTGGLDLEGIPSE